MFKDFIKKYFGLSLDTPQQPIQQPIQEEPVEIIEEDEIYSFPIAGISFHLPELKKIIKNNLDLGNIEKFKGMTNRDIIDVGFQLDIYEGYTLDGVKLEKYLFKGKEAIKVLIDDTKGNYLEMGNVPNNHLKQVLQLLNEDITTIQYEIMGGIRKTPTINDNNRDIVETENINYGILITINYKKKD